MGKREELRSLKTRDPEDAKQLFIKALAEAESRWVRLRQGPASLSEREAHEITSKVHEESLASHRDDPSKQIFWRTDLTHPLWGTPPLPPLRLRSGTNPRARSAGRSSSLRHPAQRSAREALR